MTAPVARWSVWVQPDRPVRIWRPPMTAWIGNRIAAIAASRMIGRVRGRRRSAATNTAATIKPTMTATQRWRTCAEFASVRAGNNDPFMSGQSGKTYHCDVAVTCDPNSRSAKTEPAPSAATRVKRWLPVPFSLAG